MSRKRYPAIRQPLQLIEPVCPTCGPGTSFAEVDIVSALAHIMGFKHDGTPEFEGSSTVDWDSQKPEHAQPRFACSQCCDMFTAKELMPVPALTAPGEFG